jgi:hypothetical protein
MTTLAQEPAPEAAIAPAPMPRTAPALTAHDGRQAGPCLLSELEAGRAGVIVEVRLDPGARLTGASPLRPGARVEVLEAVGPATRHVRIGYREYSVPAAIGRSIVVDCSGEPAPEAGATADTCYEIVLNRLSRGVFKLLVVRRDTGAVVRGEIVERAADAKAAREALRMEAAAMSPTAFRLRHRLP